MFRFESPLYLILFIFIPLAVFYRKSVCFNPELYISSISHVNTIKKSFIISNQWILIFIKYTSLVLLIIAMARPQWGTKQISVLTEGINIILAVDISFSMKAMDFKIDNKRVDRLEAVKKVVKDFVKDRQGDRIGVVVFGTHAYTQVPLTRDYNTIFFMMDNIKIGAAGKRTAIGDAIGISIKRLEDIKSKTKIIILLTDGESNAGKILPDVASKIAVEKKIKIYTIGVGTDGVAPFEYHHPIFGKQLKNIRVNIDEDTLKDIADKTEGLYFRANDTEGLKKIYKTIDKLEKTKVKVKSYANYKETYVYFLYPALVLLLLFILLSNTRMLKIP